eukprot:CAMPEP_0184326840 /NCGR_PEP_ID=MMETSP1049-20130417/142778_1 /TAXON_ID=77928 /ORGANISM="Proteomonas sulcata, Strain CCMP704" /LENGTH=149 /DNA_ID=CAMNT_0026649061 /DNA_START=2383 /DNA_END=2832 /DNA_ORIENTATION=-
MPDLWKEQPWHSEAILVGVTVCLVERGQYVLGRSRQLVNVQLKGKRGVSIPNNLSLQDDQASGGAGGLKIRGQVGWYIRLDNKRLLMTILQGGCCASLKGDGRVVWGCGHRLESHVVVRPKFFTRGLKDRDRGITLDPVEVDRGRGTQV